MTETFSNQTHAPEYLNEIFDVLRVTPIDGGHMMYHKCLVGTSSGDYFVKTSDDSLLTDDYQAQKMWEYLIKEQYAYDIVARHGFQHIPTAQLHNRSLVLEAHLPEKGWQWEAPLTNNDRYVDEVMEALLKLEELDGGDEIDAVDPKTSGQLLLSKGWQTINEVSLPAIDKKIQSSIQYLHSHVVGGVRLLADLLTDANAHRISTELGTYSTQTTGAIGHFDARQSNIAWHPDLGVRIVDWSWASGGLRHGDTTMFLIDLHKSNINVDHYTRKYFDPTHALLLIGYWLARSIEPSYGGDGTIRFHQLASAVSAANLLARY